MSIDVNALGERLTRRLARRVSRRRTLARMGAFLVGASAFPVLPVDRPARAAQPANAMTDFTRLAQDKDDTKCDYWRYCAIGGSLCTCCGGGVHSCPPGTAPSTTSWIGTCVNPTDKKAYLISYRDCCGASGCGNCSCHTHDRELPIYRPQSNSSIIWCFGLDSMSYHCSTAALVGLAE